MSSAYDFYYDLNESDRLVLADIGCVLSYSDGDYFPIGLSEKGMWQNYGVPKGLIRVGHVFNKKPYLPAGWLRVAAFSPDDLDMDLDFSPADDELRAKIVEYMTRLVPIDQVTYRDVLDMVQAEFGGTRTS